MTVDTFEDGTMVDCYLQPDTLVTDSCYLKARSHCSYLQVWYIERGTYLSGWYPDHSSYKAGTLVDCKIHADTLVTECYLNAWHTD